MSLQIVFGRLVRESRIAQGYTQEQLAELADITEPGLRIVTALADILGIDLNLLKPFAVHDAKGYYRKEYDVKGTTDI